MNEELDIADLDVPVHASACIEVSRSPGAMVKAAIQTVSDIVLAVLSTQI